MDAMIPEKLLVTLLLVSLYGNPAGSQTWTTFTVTNSGIPANSVYDLTIDSADNIWVATAQGLGMFDSLSWSTWDYTNSPIPITSNNSCYAVYADKDQDIWLGTDYGHLLRFDRDTTWTDYSNEGFGDINVIRQDLQGILWVGHYYGLKTFDGSTWSDLTNYLPDDYVLSIAMDPDSNVWVGTRAGLSRRDAAGMWVTFTPQNSGLIDDRIEAICAAPDGVIWAGTPDGVHRLDSSGNWTVFHSSNSPLWDDEVNSIAVDADSMVWVSNHSASIAAFSGVLWTNAFLPSGMAFARVIDIDLKGRKWVGTQEGLALYDDGGAGPILTGIAGYSPSGITVFPNPAIDHVTLRFTVPPAGNYVLSLRNSHGVEVRCIESRGDVVPIQDIHIDIRDLRPGIYFLRFSGAGRSSVHKLLVMRR